MQHTDIVNGLLQLGFDTGWVVNGDEIVLWENSKPIPDMDVIIAASKKWETTKKAEAEAKAAQRQALLSRLGLTEEKARILLGGN